LTINAPKKLAAMSKKIGVAGNMKADAGSNVVISASFNSAFLANRTEEQVGHAGDMVVSGNVEIVVGGEKDKKQAGEVKQDGVTRIEVGVKTKGEPVPWHTVTSSDGKVTARFEDQPLLGRTVNVAEAISRLPSAQRDAIVASGQVSRSVCGSPVAYIVVNGVRMDAVHLGF
jgi:hypothetical protein